MSIICPKIYPARTTSDHASIQWLGALCFCQTYYASITAYSYSCTWAWLRAENTFVSCELLCRWTYHRYLHEVSHMFGGQPIGIILWKWSIVKQVPVPTYMSKPPTPTPTRPTPPTPPPTPPSSPLLCSSWENVDSIPRKLVPEVYWEGSNWHLGYPLSSWCARSLYEVAYVSFTHHIGSINVDSRKKTTTWQRIYFAYGPQIGGYCLISRLVPTFDFAGSSYTSRNEVSGGGGVGGGGWGVCWIHPVCPSVCLSVNLSCPPCSIYSSGWILSIFGTNNQ